MGGGVDGHSAGAALSFLVIVEGRGQPGVQDGGSPRHQKSSGSGHPGEWVGQLESLLCVRYVLIL